MKLSYRNKLLFSKLLRYLLIIIGLVAVVVIVMIIYFSPNVVYDREGAHRTSVRIPQASTAPQERPLPDTSDLEIVYQQDAPLAASIQELGGYYISTAMLQDPQKVLTAVQAIEEPCAVMLDVKSIWGNFYYSSGVNGAQRADVDISAIDQLISYLDTQGFYMIASVPAFSDPVFALEHQSSGLPISGGALWMDENGCYWLDPADEEVMTYLMQIARDLAGKGFSEIAFSGFVFPDSENIVYESSKTKAEIIQEAAAQLTNLFTGSETMISFVSERTDFPADACTGRLYIPDVSGGQVDLYIQSYRTAQTLSELVFLSSSSDTRFEGQSVLRPLMAE